MLGEQRGRETSEEERSRSARVRQNIDSQGKKCHRQEDAPKRKERNSHRPKRIFGSPFFILRQRSVFWSPILFWDNRSVIWSLTPFAVLYDTDLWTSKGSEVWVEDRVGYDIKRLIRHDSLWKSERPVWWLTHFCAILERPRNDEDSRAFQRREEENR